MTLQQTQAVTRIRRVREEWRIFNPEEPRGDVDVLLDCIATLQAELLKARRDGSEVRAAMRVVHASNHELRQAVRRLQGLKAEPVPPVSTEALHA